MSTAVSANPIRGWLAPSDAHAVSRRRAVTNICGLERLLNRGPYGCIPTLFNVGKSSPHKSAFGAWIKTALLPLPEPRLPTTPVLERCKARSAPYSTSAYHSFEQFRPKLSSLPPAASH